MARTGAVQQMEKLWKRVWAYCPLDLSASSFCVCNEVQRIELPVNARGEGIRIRLSNAYGKAPLPFRWIRLGGGDERSFSFLGSHEVCLMPGQELWSDPLPAEVEPDRTVVIETCVTENTPVDTGVCFCTEKAGRVHFTDAVTGAMLSPFRGMTAQDPRCRVIYGLCEAEVLCGADTAVIAAFGDSITHMSFWTGALQQTMLRKYPGRGNVIDLGIGGNRILRDTPEKAGVGRLFGPAGIRRFEKEVFHGDETAVLILEGVNDLWHPFAYDLPEERCGADDLIRGLSFYASAARKHHGPAWCGTVLPFIGQETVTWEMEEERLKLNAWIRASACFAGVLDYDRALRDPGCPERLDPRYDSGDHLHPGLSGGERMAEEIPLDAVLNAVSRGG